MSVFLLGICVLMVCHYGIIWRMQTALKDLPNDIKTLKKMVLNQINLRQEEAETRNALAAQTQQHLDAKKQLEKRTRTTRSRFSPYKNNSISYFTNALVRPVKNSRRINSSYSMKQSKKPTSLNRRHWKTRKTTSPSPSTNVKNRGANPYPKAYPAKKLFMI